MIMKQNHRLNQADKVARALSSGRYRTKMLVWRQSIKMAKFMKRTFDIFSSLLLLILLSPLFLLTAAAISLESPGPVLFTQSRVGKNGKYFNFFKFRSMVADAERFKQQLQHKNESGDGVIFKMKSDPRVTTVGKFIRKFSIDELPQLFNVLAGNMSLVGPRPALPGEVEKYTLEQRKRLHVTPGITCIWQVSGRSEIPFSGQVRLDVEYIRSTSLWKDIVILAKTIPAVFSGKGAY